MKKSDCPNIAGEIVTKSAFRAQNHNFLLKKHVFEWIRLRELNYHLFAPNRDRRGNFGTFSLGVNFNYIFWFFVWAYVSVITKRLWVGEFFIFCFSLWFLCRFGVGWVLSQHEALNDRLVGQHASLWTPSSLIMRYPLPDYSPPRYSKPERSCCF